MVVVVMEGMAPKQATVRSREMRRRLAPAKVRPVDVAAGGDAAAKREMRRSTVLRKARQQLRTRGLRRRETGSGANSAAASSKAVESSPVASNHAASSKAVASNHAASNHAVSNHAVSMAVSAAVEADAASRGDQSPTAQRGKRVPMTEGRGETSAKTTVRDEAAMAVASRATDNSPHSRAASRAKVIRAVAMPRVRPRLAPPRSSHRPRGSKRAAAPRPTALPLRSTIAISRGRPRPPWRGAPTMMARPPRSASRPTSPRKRRSTISIR